MGGLLQGFHPESLLSQINAKPDARADGCPERATHRKSNGRASCRTISDASPRAGTRTHQSPFRQHRSTREDGGARHPMHASDAAFIVSAEPTPIRALEVL